jgi:hypothetical protein
MAETKQRYQRPVVTEYGPIEQVTRGVFGTQPDNTTIFGFKISNNACNPTLPFQTCAQTS